MAPDVLRAAIPACLMFVGAAHANERSAELVNSFMAFCTPGPPDFAALDAKATAMNLPVRKDVAMGADAHTKSWQVTLKTGVHELIVGKVKGPAGDVAGCSIGAENADGEEMKQDLIKAMKLDAPDRVANTPDGAQRVTSWKYADDVTLILADGTPMKIPGMMLTLMRQTKPSP
jgi:hypothetical protein